MSSYKTGIEVVATFAGKLPGRPGVYRMYNHEKDVLYVGKARNLKKRVSSYTKLMGQTNRIMQMIRQTAHMEFVTTRTEAEALLLEANFIKRLRPKYNVLLRDDKSFPYILIGGDHPVPQLFKHRGAQKQKGQYFGPFASARAVNRTITALQKAFLLRNCSDSYYENRTRPCLLYQIKRCSAPCTGEVSQEDYLELVEQAKAFLSGKSKRIQAELVAKMEHAADEMDFETAAKYRDRIAAFSHIHSEQGIHPKTISEADLFAIYQEAGLTCIQAFFFRAGQNWGHHAYFPLADSNLDLGDVLEAFLMQFYDDKPAPSQVLVSHAGKDHDLLAQALSARMEGKVNVLCPQRGEKHRLIGHAVMNAKETLGRKFAETQSQQKLLDGLRLTFKLEKAFRRVEVYDNSHIMGSHPVGAMIVSGTDGFMKNQYRKFNMKSQDLTPGDDFAMMREMINRRFSRILKEEKAFSDDEQSNWPDMLLIDGGRGQVKAVEETLHTLGIHGLPVVGVAKGPDRNAGRETFFIAGKKPFTLPVRDPILYFIQRLRDEAHRFAIGAHRTRRKKALAQNPLDEIPGIGPTRKRALLRAFGTAKAVGNAGLKDLQSVPGVSGHLAQTIFDYFHK